MIRLATTGFLLLASALLTAPAEASPDPGLLDEITIRVIGDENPEIEVNDLALPPAHSSAGDNSPGPASENADERATRASGNAADRAMESAAEKAARAAENAAEAAENAAEAREKASEAADKGKGKGKNKIRD